MKYGAHLFFNQNRMAMLNGYKEGDPLKLSTLIIFPEADTPLQAAEQVFQIANAEDRPNGKTERSMSVGDVVRIIGAVEGSPPSFEVQEFWFKCESVGFEEISKPDLTNGPRVDNV